MTLFFFISEQKQLKKNIHLIVKNQSDQLLFQCKTPLKISEEDWDSQKERPSNIYLKKNKKINAKLDALKILLTDCIDKGLSPKAFSKKIQDLCSRDEIEYPVDSLLYFIKSYISAKKEYICRSTYKRYKVFFNLVERFDGYMAQRSCLSAVNNDFVKNFISFGKEEAYSENTIYRTIHFIKTILNFAERKGIRTNIREIDIRKERKRRNVINLTENEIQKIEKTDVPQELQAAKDWLLISCYTGQRISDFMKFCTEQLTEINDRICISFMQQKTQKEVLLPVHPVILEIIERNHNNFPRKLSPTNYNNHIKKIAQIAQIDESINAVKRIGHRVKNLKVKKWEVLTSHIGRRSFATNFYGKIPTPLLMEATGHSTEQMFLKYINPVDENRILSLSNYFDKIHQERQIV